MSNSNEKIKLQAQKAYHLELFLSVDVAGSTAFKFSNNLSNGSKEDGSTSKGWFETIRKFYVLFHSSFLNNVSNFLEENAELTQVELWKALGDELIYRVTVDDRHFTAKVIKAFIDAMHHTRRVVRAQNNGLDLKASAWVADFPARNAEISLDGLQSSLHSNKESQQHPAPDYIGPSMDAGFRLGKVASRRKMSLSVELSLILASAQSEKRSYPFIFGYDGKEDFKGVLGGDGYPTIWIDVEDDEKQRESNRRESAMLQRQPEVPAEVVLDFCRSFIGASHWMEFPYLKKENGDPFCNIPSSHIEYTRCQTLTEEAEATLYAEEAPISVTSFDDQKIDLGHILTQYSQFIQNIKTMAPPCINAPSAGQRGIKLHNNRNLTIVDSNTRPHPRRRSLGLVHPVSSSVSSSMRSRWARTTASAALVISVHVSPVSPSLIV